MIFSAWEHGSGYIRLFANYRDIFKPAAIDFSIGDAGDERLLKPETSKSYETGLKARVFQGRMSMELASFLMDFDNLVISQTVNGLPSLTNAGKQRFKGIETAAAWYLPAHIAGRVTYSYHDARFRNFIQEFDPGAPMQLAGKRFEMSARNLFSAGLT